MSRPHPFYLPPVIFGLFEEEACLLWGAQKNPELRLFLDGRDTTLDIRFRIEESGEPKVVLNFLGQEPLSQRTGQQWSDFRRTLAEFFAERQEVELAAWEEEEYVIWVRSADFLEAGRLMLELAQFLRGYLVGARLIVGA